MADFPANLQYTAEHEWLDASSPAVIGITSRSEERRVGKECPV